MRNHIYRSILLTAFFITGLNINLFAIEEPKYEVLKEYDEFEIREYSSFIIAETEVVSNQEDAASDAFSTLFDFISGENTKREEIAMTAPVIQAGSEQKSEEISMTVPVRQVAQSENEGRYLVSFVMPLSYNINTVPVPNDERITIKEVPKRIMAVRKYSGTWSEENYNENEEILLNELEMNEYQITGSPEFARYNPPILPWFLRRNEVMVEIKIPEPENS